MNAGTTRRATIGAGAALLVAGAAPGGAHPDAALLAACSELQRLTADLDAIDVPGSALVDADVDSRLGAWWDATRLVTRIPATTAAGARAKAGAAAAAFKRAIGRERGIDYHERATPLVLLALAALDDAAGVKM